MKCENIVMQWVEHRMCETEAQCGTTGVNGVLLLCRDCEHTREKRERNGQGDNAWLASAGWGEI